jgi:multisubunit Na+/H+ antiporter MnhG subunit
VVIVRGAVTRLGALPRAAPGTLIYLFTLLITQLTLNTVDDRLGERLLISESTNLVNMARVPVQVLIGSAFWIDAGPVWTAAALLTVVAVLGPVEHWLGTARWLVVTAVGHVGATLLTVVAAVGLLRLGRISPAVAHASDVGVSYAVMAGLGVLLHRLRRPGRRVGAVLVALALLAVPWFLDHQVADLGHPLALFLGFALYLLVPAVRPSRRDRAGAPSTRPGVPHPTPPGDATGSAARGATTVADGQILLAGRETS